MEDETEPTELLISISPPPDYEQYHEIADSISAYIESVPTISYAKCIEDIMNFFPHYAYRVLQPDHTFHI